MIVLSGADLVLPDRIISPGTLTIEGDRIADIRPGTAPGGQVLALAGHYVLPGFIDVHVHGVDGIDTLDAGRPVTAMAGRLPRYGVTAFCPTTVACEASALARVLDDVRRARTQPNADAARVLPAHLESNFINPDYRGAQPVDCLRRPRAALQARAADPRGTATRGADEGALLRTIELAAPDIAIVTVAPELDGGIELVGWLASQRVVVSLGHSAATYDEGVAAIAAGARQATHLFNRMPPMNHRAPGLAGAVLQSEEVAAELVCDGFHVHPAVARAAIAAKHPSRILAITDGTAAAGLAVGTRAALGGQPITARERGAFLDDGTLAGSVLTMDRAFRMLVEGMGFSLIDAATMCSTTPARELGLVGHGVLAVDAVADLVVLDRRLSVVKTFVGGRGVYSRPQA
jgi:N-acetylglucosamine-6-phosphate deacetylase